MFANTLCDNICHSLVKLFCKSLSSFWVAFWVIFRAPPLHSSTPLEGRPDHPLERFDYRYSKPTHSSFELLSLEFEWCRISHRASVHFEYPKRMRVWYLPPMRAPMFSSRETNERAIISQNEIRIYLTISSSSNIFLKYFCFFSVFFSNE